MAAAVLSTMLFYKGNLGDGPPLDETLYILEQDYSGCVM